MQQISKVVRTPPLLPRQRVVLRPPAHLPWVMLLVEVLQVMFLVELLHPKVRAPVQLLHLLLQPQLQLLMQLPVPHHAAPLVLATDAI